MAEVTVHEGDLTGRTFRRHRLPIVRHERTRVVVKERGRLRAFALPSGEEIGGPNRARISPQSLKNLLRRPTSQLDLPFELDDDQIPNKPAPADHR